MSNKYYIYFHCATLTAFFDLFLVKPTSLTLFFEENMSEKGWVVSLKVNESEFSNIKISKKVWLILKKQL